VSPAVPGAAEFLYEFLLPGFYQVDQLSLGSGL